MNIRPLGFRPAVSTVKFGNSNQGTGSVIHVKTKADFENEIANSALPVIIKFSAPWCGPCKAIQPYVETKAKQYQGKAKIIEAVVFDKSNPDDASMQEVATQYKIQAVPTFVLVNQGKEVQRGVSKQGFDTILQSL